MPAPGEVSQTLVMDIEMATALIPMAIIPMAIMPMAIIG